MQRLSKKNNENIAFQVMELSRPSGLFPLSALSTPHFLIPLTLASLYRHPFFAYAGLCLECLLTSLLAKGFLIRETFIEHLLCARFRARPWGYKYESDKVPFPPGTQCLNRGNV